MMCLPASHQLILDYVYVWNLLVLYSYNNTTGELRPFLL